ncbi:MAG TPA: hypothetical protein VNU92_08670 [Edaphobacter sp.]|nr:hypothetical protein [Edaphobacter sp.]
MVASLIAWPFTKAHLQAIAMLQLASGQKVPWIIRKLVLEPVRSEAINFPTVSGIVHGRIYLPEHHPKAPGLIVLHGVHHLGVDEPRLVGFANAMASCGLRVLTPELADIKDYHIDLNSVSTIGESAKWFAGQTGRPVAVMGLSFSGGLALVAAANTAYSPDFKFVFAVGSQDQMAHVANFYLTGKELRPDGTTEELRPHEYGSLVLEYEHLEDFVSTADEEAIRPVLREHLYENKVAEQAAESKLDDRQRAEAIALMNSDNPETKQKLAISDVKHAHEMEDLSPHGKLVTMTTPVFLLHGQADNIIPAAETQWMETEIPRTILQSALVSPVLSHVNLDGAKPNAGDLWRLVHFFALVLHTAERN